MCTPFKEHPLGQCGVGYSSQSQSENKPLFLVSVTVSVLTCNSLSLQRCELNAWVCVVVYVLTNEKQALMFRWRRPLERPQLVRTLPFSCLLSIWITEVDIDIISMINGPSLLLHSRTPPMINTATISGLRLTWTTYVERNLAYKKHHASNSLPQ